MSAGQDVTHAQGGNGAGAAHPIYERREQMIEDLQRNVPHELREYSAWLLWKAMPKDGKPASSTRFLRTPAVESDTATQGSAQDVEHLTDFAGAMAALRDHGQELRGRGLRAAALSSGDGARPRQDRHRRRAARARAPRCSTRARTAKRARAAWAGARSSRASSVSVTSRITRPASRCLSRPDSSP